MNLDTVFMRTIKSPGRSNDDLLKHMPPLSGQLHPVYEAFSRKPGGHYHHSATKLAEEGADFDHNQKSTILALSKVTFDQTNAVHRLMLDTVRDSFADAIPANTLTKLNIRQQLTEISHSFQGAPQHIYAPSPRNMDIYSESLFEKDISEAIGFTMGYKEYMDINRECGMLGVLCTM